MQASMSTVNGDRVRKENGAGPVVYHEDAIMSLPDAYSTLPSHSVSRQIFFDFFLLQKLTWIYCLKL